MKSAVAKNQFDPAACPEHELLIHCARAKMDSLSEMRIHLLVKQAIDWNSLIEMARPHGMLPLLYWNLKSVCADDVPSESMTRLKDLFLENHKRNLFLAAELVKVLDQLRSRGFTALAYKGPTISTSIYGNLALRQFADLDILVRKTDFIRARDFLIAQGYESELRIAPARHRAFIKVNYVQSLRHRDTKAVVELHWRVTPRNFAFPFDFDSLWERAVEIEIVGQKVLMPSREDLLLLLCVHGTKDLWDRLEWICGVAEIIRGNANINWEQVLREAHRTSSTRILFLGLALAHKVVGAYLPSQILKKVQNDGSVNALVDLIRTRLFQSDKSRSLAFKIRFQLKAHGRLRDAIRYCVRLALDTTHGDWAVIDLPEPLSFLYYFVRPFRLLKTYIRLSHH